jgi:hypothetical protein
MLDLNAPDTALLNNPANRENQPLDYAIRALHWLYWSKAQDNPHLAHLDPHFMEAIEAVLTFFNAGANLPAADAAARIREHTAYWRRDLDAAAHPLSQLGRVLRGDPGGHLEYPGPVFLLTFAEVLEGITHEFVVPEWDLNDARSAHTLIALAAIVLSEIAITCYWVLRANGAHLDTELGRLFGPANRAALVGQLGNLVLAGQVCGWDCRVDFIPEGDDPTPEWSVTRGGQRVLVECTSYERLAEEVNDAERINSALVTAWNAKRSKFTGQGGPGLISTDISGVVVSREFGAILATDHWRRVDAVTPLGHARPVGCYELARDWELLQQESQNRQLLGVMTSALYSADAQQRDIRGLMAYQGQQVVVDLVNDAFRVPKRGLLVWRGHVNDPDLNQVLVSLHQPAAPRPLPPGRLPQLSLFLI